MPEPNHKDLRYAENLRREGKLQEALNIIQNIENKGALPPRDQLSLLISKGKIFTKFQKYGESARIGELALRLGQGLETVPDTIMALLFKSNILFLGKFNEAIDYVNEAENLLNSLTDVSPSFISRLKADIWFRKAWVCLFQGKTNEALEAAMKCREIQEKFKTKSDIAYTFLVIGNIYNAKNDNRAALDYALKSLKMFEEIGDSVGAATTLSFLGVISYHKGQMNQALNYTKKSLSTKVISDRTKLNNFFTMGNVYSMKGEIERGLRYYKRGSSLAERINSYQQFINFNFAIGYSYMTKGEYELAIEYLKPSLTLSKKINNLSGISASLINLSRVYSQMELQEELQDALDQLKEYGEKYNFEFALNGYRLEKAIMLKKSGRSHNRAEAEKLLKQVVEEFTMPYIYIPAVVYLCEFYLEELEIFNDPEILEELNPLIKQLLKFAKEQNSYLVLAETKLLEAKLKLIEMDIEAAQRLLTQGQRIAELYGLNYTAQKISSEHDNLLEHIKTWEDLKERDAPITERLKLASFDGVIERLQGRSAIEPPKLVEEEPILLLIMDNSGSTYFNHLFEINWDYSDLFSSFMSAFNNFSSEIFSKSIDRIRIGENIILINPIESFLACYVIKGQSYLALQKLTRFTEAIRENSEIWQALNKSVKTSEMLELDNPPALKTVIDEIFTN